MNAPHMRPERGNISNATNRFDRGSNLDNHDVVAAQRCCVGFFARMPERSISLNIQALLKPGFGQAIAEAQLAFNSATVRHITIL
jgi:hypothetical protein